MPSFNPPIRSQAFRFFVALPSQSNPLVMQANPTLASGDAQVSKDGGTLANLGTLPAVTPASSKLIQVDLSAAEMDADNVTVVLSDASGAEWCDLVVNVQPSSLLLSGAVDDASATTTAFASTLTGYGDDFFNDAFLLFTDGTLQNQARKVSDYVSATGTFTLTPALTSAPADDSPFAVLGRSG